MTLDIIKNLFFTFCFTIILFISASSIYLVRSNYYKTVGVIEESICTPIPNSNLYACDLTISYLIKGNYITNQLVKRSKGLSVKDVPQELIELKRKQLTLTRQIKKNGKDQSSDNNHKDSNN